MDACNCITPRVQFFTDTFLRFCSFREMGPHSVLMFLLELRENPQYYADEHTNKMESCNKAEYGVMEGSDRGQEEKGIGDR